MITRCLNCGAVLTNDREHRNQTAHFDSSLPTHPHEFDVGRFCAVSWARCDACYQVAQIMAEINRRLEINRKLEEDHRKLEEDL